jgi:hypothetical protein
VEFIDFLLKTPLWILFVASAAILGIIWMVITALAAFFIFTGPPDTFDVDIKDSGKDKK